MGGRDALFGGRASSVLEASPGTVNPKGMQLGNLGASSTQDDASSRGATMRPKTSQRRPPSRREDERRGRAGWGGGGEPPPRNPRAASPRCVGACEFRVYWRQIVIAGLVSASSFSSLISVRYHTFPTQGPRSKVRSGRPGALAVSSSHTPPRRRRGQRAPRATGGPGARGFSDFRLFCHQLGLALSDL